MKKRMPIAKWTPVRTWTVALWVAVIAAAKPDIQANDPQSQDTLEVDVQDLAGQASPDTEQTREDLLQDALYRAAESRAWATPLHLRYNTNVNRPSGAELDVVLIRWERTPTGIYQCSLAVRYRDADGQSIDLGTFYGMRSSIDLPSQWDTNDKYRDAAKDAFAEALDKLKEIVTQS